MAIKNRSDLKSYFVRNAILTEGNYADLIDSQLNQAEGVFKPDGEPLSVVAASGDQKPALRLYASYPADNPDWLISLQPAQDPADAAATSRPGFGITDGAGRTRLFIDAATGQMGVGTNAPEASLHVRNANTVGVFESSTTQAVLRLATSEGAANRVELANRAGGNAAISVGTAGDAFKVMKDGRVIVSSASGGVGDLTVENYLRFPNAAPKDKIVIWDGGATDRFGIGLNASNINLFYPTNARFSLRQNSSAGTEVFSVNAAGLAKFYGPIVPKIGNDGNSGIYFPTNPGGGTGDEAFLRYYVTSGETTKLVLGINNDSGDALVLWQAGSERINISNDAIYMTAANTYYSGNFGRGSDLALKHDVRALAGVLAGVMRLRPVRFAWNRDETQDLGFIAQDFESEFPEAVFEIPHEAVPKRPLKALSTHHLGVIAIAALRELKQEYDARLAALKHEIDQLRSGSSSPDAPLTPEQ